MRAAALLAFGLAVLAPNAASAQGSAAPRQQEQGGLWAEQATSLFEVVSGEDGEDTVRIEKAQHDLAVLLYEHGFLHASLELLGRIADQPAHARFEAALPWLARIAIRLPESAEVGERISRYDAASIARLEKDASRPLEQRVQYLIGRYAYDARNLPLAIEALSRLGDDGPDAPRALFLIGLARAQSREAPKALVAFEAMLKTVETHAKTLEGASRLRDLAHLAIARTHYSTAIRLDGRGEPKVDAKKLAEAMEHWARIDAGSDSWGEALFESSWAYFMAGDYSRALGNIHTVESPYFPRAAYPEAEVLRGLVYFASCDDDRAAAAAHRVKHDLAPIRQGLAGFIEGFSRDDSDERFFAFVREVHLRSSGLDPDLAPVIERALGDRSLETKVALVDEIDSEKELWKKQSASFRGSDLGAMIADAVDLARAIAVEKTCSAARDRLDRALGELDQNLDGAQKILRATGTSTIGARASGRGEAPPSQIVALIGSDEEHEVWPFDGEYWRDELGSYREITLGKCSR